MRPVGRYLLRELLGRGGMGEVFRAIAVGADGFEKPVVVKRILPALEGSDAAAMFSEEAKRMSLLTHPNIVQVLDFGRGEHGDYFLVMEIVEGLDVGAFARSHGDERVPIALALFIIGQMLRGLDYAHTQAYADGRSLVHRDVSPGNVLLSRLGEVKLADFGVAIVARPGETSEQGSLVGKPSYMAPEQFRGEPVDARADLFATGVLLFQLLTNAMPFSGSDAEARQAEALAGRAKRASDLRGEIGEAIDVLIAQSLAPDPNARFASARAMRRALEAASPEPLASSDDLADAVRAAMQKARSKGKVVLALAPDMRLGELTRLDDATGTFSLRMETDDTVADAPRTTERRWLGALVLAIAAGAAGWWALREAPAIAEPWPSTTITLPSKAPASAPAPPASAPAPPPPRAVGSMAAQPPPAPAACEGAVILAGKGSWDVSGGPKSAQAPHRDTWPCGTYTLTGTSRQDGRVVTRTLVVREGAQNATRFE